MTYYFIAFPFHVILTFKNLKSFVAPNDITHYEKLWDSSVSPSLKFWDCQTWGLLGLGLLGLVLVL